MAGLGLDAGRLSATRRGARIPFQSLVCRPSPASRRRLTVAACINHAMEDAGTCGRRVVLAGVSASAATVCRTGKAFAAEGGRTGRVHHSDLEWRNLLTKEQYRVLRQAGTERAGSSPLDKVKQDGVFRCVGCGSPVFTTSAKFNSGTGWPSFYQPIEGAVLEVPDNSIFFMPRTEVRCATCEGHLGHVFDDGPPPTGLRYCMNGVAMTFTPGRLEA